uniref:F-box domain-containing protein n=1 Tax=Clytia hemisphaerica TaxID=252671 RepID=A0A7M5TV43_9CNID
MTDFNILPNELLKMVISYLDKKDAKNFARVSKRMQKLTLDRLWSKPIYLRSKSLKFLKRISRFPIKELRAKDFRCYQAQIVEMVPSLKSLNVDMGYAFMPALNLTDLKFPIVAHTRLMKICSIKDFNDLLKALETGFIKELIIDSRYFYTMRLTPKLLKSLVGKVYISEISVNALHFTDKNVERFCKIFSTMKKCRISFPPVRFSQDNDNYILDDTDLESDHEYLVWKKFFAYKFTVKDIKTFARYNIKISFMSSSVLGYKDYYSDLLKFIPVLRQLKYLRCFELEEDACFNHSELERFSGLPITNMKTNVFELSRENVGDFVDAISKIKTLQHIHMVWNYYKFTPEDFALFKNLPVKKINLTALDLTKQNVPKFRQIMNEMKIEKFISLLSKKKKWSLGIRLRQFGPGGIYWSI